MQEKMMAEATKRLEILQEMGLWEDVMKLWQERGTVCVTEEQILFGHCGVNFTFDERPELKIIKEKFEAEYGYVVYYGIYSDTNLGRLLALLFVSTYEQDWELDRADLKKCIPCAYVWNFNDEYNEMGSVKIKMASGGLINVSA